MNFTFKFNTKFVVTLEKNLHRLFELNIKKQVMQTEVDADIIFHSAAYIQYEQCQLDDNARTYLETTLISRRALRTGIKPTPYQKSYEINTGAQSFVIDFRGVNKQFSFLGMFLVYDKSNQHITGFNSLNIELASTKNRTLTLENTSNTYSTSNGVKFDTGDKHEKYLLYHLFGPSVCNGCSIAPLTDYANNDVFKELPSQKEFFTNSDKNLFMDYEEVKDTLVNWRCYQEMIVILL